MPPVNHLETSPQFTILLQVDERERERGKEKRRVQEGKLLGKGSLNKSLRHGNTSDLTLGVYIEGQLLIYKHRDINSLSVYSFAVSGKNRHHIPPLPALNSLREKVLK